MSTMEKANSFQTIKMSTMESLLKAKRTVVEPKNIIMGTDIKEGGSMMREVDLVLSLTPKRNKREPEIGLQTWKRVNQRKWTLAPGKT